MITDNKISNYSVSLDLIKCTIKSLEDLESAKRSVSLTYLSSKMEQNLSVLLNLPIECEIRKFIFGTKKTLIAFHSEFVIFLETPIGPIQNLLVERIATFSFLNGRHNLYNEAKFALWDFDMKNLYTVNMSKDDVGKLHELFYSWVKTW